VRSLAPTNPLRTRREWVAPFSNISQTNPSSMNAVGAILEDGERVMMDPTMI